MTFPQHRHEPDWNTLLALRECVATVQSRPANYQDALYVSASPSTWSSTETIPSFIHPRTEALGIDGTLKTQPNAQLHSDESAYSNSSSSGQLSGTNADEDRALSHPQTSSAKPRRTQLRAPLADPHTDPSSTHQARTGARQTANLPRLSSATASHPTSTTTSSSRARPSWLVVDTREPAGMPGSANAGIVPAADVEALLSPFPSTQGTDRHATATRGEASLSMVAAPASHAHVAPQSSTPSSVNTDNSTSAQESHSFHTSASFGASEVAAEEVVEVWVADNEDDGEADHQGSENNDEGVHWDRRHSPKDDERSQHGGRCADEAVLRAACGHTRRHGDRSSQRPMPSMRREDSEESVASSARTERTGTTATSTSMCSRPSRYNARLFAPLDIPVAAQQSAHARRARAEARGQATVLAPLPPPHSPSDDDAGYARRASRLSGLQTARSGLHQPGDLLWQGDAQAKEAPHVRPPPQVIERAAYSPPHLCQPGVAQSAADAMAELSRDPAHCSEHRTESSQASTGTSEGRPRSSVSSSAVPHARATMSRDRRGASGSSSSSLSHGARRRSPSSGPRAQEEAKQAAALSALWDAVRALQEAHERQRPAIVGGDASSVPTTSAAPVGGESAADSSTRLRSQRSDPHSTGDHLGYAGDDASPQHELPITLRTDTAVDSATGCDDDAPNPPHTPRYHTYLTPRGTHTVRELVQPTSDEATAQAADTHARTPHCAYAGYIAPPFTSQLLNEPSVNGGDGDRGTAGQTRDGDGVAGEEAALAAASFADSPASGSATVCSAATESTRASLGLSAAAALDGVTSTPAPSLAAPVPARRGQSATRERLQHHYSSTVNAGDDNEDGGDDEENPPPPRSPMSESLTTPLPQEARPVAAAPPSPYRVPPVVTLIATGATGEEMAFDAPHTPRLPAAATAPRGPRASEGESPSVSAAEDSVIISHDSSQGRVHGGRLAPHGVEGTRLPTHVAKAVMPLSWLDPSRPDTPTGTSGTSSVIAHSSVSAHAPVACPHSHAHQEAAVVPGASREAQAANPKPCLAVVSHSCRPQQLPPPSPPHTPVRTHGPSGNTAQHQTFSVSTLRETQRSPASDIHTPPPPSARPTVPSSSSAAASSASWHALHSQGEDSPVPSVRRGTAATEKRDPDSPTIAATAAVRPPSPRAGEARPNAHRADAPSTSGDSSSTSLGPTHQVPPRVRVAACTGLVSHAPRRPSPHEESREAVPHRPSMHVDPTPPVLVRVDEPSSDLPGDRACAPRHSTGTAPYTPDGASNVASRCESTEMEVASPATAVSRSSSSSSRHRESGSVGGSLSSASDGVSAVTTPAEADQPAAVARASVAVAEARAPITDCIDCMAVSASNARHSRSGMRHGSTAESEDSEGDRSPSRVSDEVDGVSWAPTCTSSVPERPRSTIPVAELPPRLPSESSSTPLAAAPSPVKPSRLRSASPSASSTCSHYTGSPACHSAQAARVPPHSFTPRTAGEDPPRGEPYHIGTHEKDDDNGTGDAQAAAAAATRPSWRQYAAPPEPSPMPPIGNPWLRHYTQYLRPSSGGDGTAQQTGPQPDARISASQAYPHPPPASVTSSQASESGATAASVDLYVEGIYHYCRAMSDRSSTTLFDDLAPDGEAGGGYCGGGDVNDVMDL